MSGRRFQSGSSHWTFLCSLSEAATRRPHLSIGGWKNWTRRFAGSSTGAFRAVPRYRWARYQSSEGPAIWKEEDWSKRSWPDDVAMMEETRWGYLLDLLLFFQWPGELGWRSAASFLVPQSSTSCLEVLTVALKALFLSTNTANSSINQITIRHLESRNDITVWFTSLVCYCHRVNVTVETKHI